MLAKNSLVTKLPIMQPTPRAPRQATTSIDRLLRYWYNLLAKKQYSEQELIKKARLKQYEEGDISDAISKIKSQHLIHDDLVADSVASRFLGIKGKRYVSIALKKRGLSDQLIQSSIEEYQETISPSTLQAIKRKFGGISDVWERRTKLMRYLLSRGYTNYQQILPGIESELDNTTIS
jgi:regulatory protein